MARKPTTAARMSQAMRHPFSPYLSMMKGTSSATRTRPTEAPVAAVPVATPRRRCENHRAIMVCAGMFEPAAPTPERKRPAERHRVPDGEPGDDHADAGQQQSAGHHPPRTEARRERASDDGHDHVAGQVGRGQGAGLGVRQTEAVLHRRQDGGVAEPGQAERTEHDEQGHGQDRPSIAGAWACLRFHVALS